MSVQIEQKEQVQALKASAIAQLKELKYSNVAQSQKIRVMLSIAQST